MSVSPAIRQKLFVLRVFTSDKVGGSIGDNSDKLNAELDRGWQVASYEVILADAERGNCHVLVHLTTPITKPIALPPRVPPSPVPPPSKLFVLSTTTGDPKSEYNDQTDLSAELDRGWVLDCFQVILACPGDSSCFVLVKLNNNALQTLAATPPV